MSEECAKMNNNADDNLPLQMKGDAWFGSVKSAVNLAQRGMHGVFNVKQCHALYPKQYIDEALKDAPGGVSIVMKGCLNEHDLFAVGYRYSSKKTLFFVMTDGAGSTSPGEPYQMKFVDEHGNVDIRYVERPDVIAKFFRDSNCVDSENHLRQHELALEKTWVTHDSYFRLSTTHIGINVTDTWNLLMFHSLIPLHVSQLYNDGRMPLRSFAGVLSAELLKLADIEGKKLRLTQLRMQHSWMDMSSSDDDNNEDEHDNVDMEADEDGDGLATPPPTYTYVNKHGKRINGCMLVDTFMDGNGRVHSLTRFPIVVTGKKQKRRAMVQRCDACGKDTTMFCNECGLPYCYSSGNSGHGRKCFQHHVPSRRQRNIQNVCTTY